MKILAIETSCDDTGIAILKIKNSKFEVLANIIASQIEIHKPYGGVYPSLAKREHLKNLPIVLKKSLKKAKISKPEEEIDLIAVTQGPGLEPCLWTGIGFAQQLSKNWNLPVVPVNHIEAHILVNFLSRPKEQSASLPAVALVVSGGHTQLILVNGIGKYKILGETRDDAAGECFDKCARILGLGYPGGPEIAKLAWKLDRRPTSIQLPRPMINTEDYDFSFSGLKTAVLYAWQKQNKKSLKLKKEFSAEIQQAVIDVLIKKTIKAIKDCNAKTLILGGGVSANAELRKQFSQKLQTLSFCNLLFPEPSLSTDNALMIAITAYFNRTKKVALSKVAIIKAQANLQISK